MSNEILYGEVLQKQLVLNIYETAARLKTAPGYADDCIALCEARLRKELDCRYSAVLCRINYNGDNMVDLGFGAFKSEALFKNLNGARQAYIFAVTLGFGVDRLITKLAVTSAAECFITDALASAFSEAAAEYAEAEIKGGTVCRPRFSPGYGDLPLQIQPDILNSVSAEKLLHITLNKSLLMSPSKSITAIMGIEK